MHGNMNVNLLAIFFLAERQRGFQMQANLIKLQHYFM